VKRAFQLDSVLDPDFMSFMSRYFEDPESFEDMMAEEEGEPANVSALTRLEDLGQRMHHFLCKQCLTTNPYA